MESLYYPRILRRVQASFIDGAYIVLCLLVVVFLPPMGDWSFVKPTIVVAAVLFNDPCLVTLTGGSIGHHVMKIRVIRFSGSGHINIAAATLRFIMKALFGWLSYAFVVVTAKHQALHDMLAGSIVVYQSVDALPAEEKLVDRPSLNDAYVMPSGWRRFGIGLAYFVFTYALCSLLLGFIISSRCLYESNCSAADRSIEMVGSVLWLASACAIVIFAWRGQIYGARRKSKDLDATVWAPRQ